MKIYKYFPAICIFFLVYFFINTNIVLPQGFNSITSPDGLNLVAVGNAGKMYRSGNSGSTWVNFPNGALNQNCVTSLGNDVWIAANSGTVYKTLKTVSYVNIYTVGSSNNLNSITFVDANTGFTCGELGAVYKTVNGGVNWSVSNAGITGGQLNSISFRDANNGTVVGNTGYIYVTTDGGTSWLVQLSGTINNLLKVKYFNDSLVVAGENGTLLLNTGSGWTSVSTRIKSDIRGVTGTSMSDVHVCGGGGFIRNNKSGSNGFLNFEKNPMMANLVDIFYYDNNKGWAVSSLNGVIIYTTNGGTSWSMPASATVAFNWVSKSGASGNFLGNNICAHPNNKDVVFIGFSNKVYRSSNRGENWSQIGINIPTANNPHSLFVSPLDTNLIMVATEGTSGDKVYRTTNYGASWDQVLSLAGRTFSNYGQPLEIDQNNPNVFYFAPDGGGFYKSTDNGATFVEISGNYPFRSPCEILVTWDNSNVIILGDGVTGTGVADMFRSVNGGVNWTKISSAASSETPSMCNTVFDNSLVWCTEWSGSNIYKSTNMGANFSLHHNTGFSGWGSDISREDPTMVITGGWSTYATLSTDGGQSWTEIRTGLNGHGGGILAAERGFVLAQQGNNVFKLNIAYTYTPLNGTLFTQVNIKLAPEGLYNGSTLNLQDTISAYLRNVSAPFALVDSAKTTVDPVSLIAACVFQNAPSGTYYIQIKHRNSLETWSKNGENFVPGITSNYDFTSLASQAYGNNQVLVGSKWCLYSGDVDRDGSISLTDLLSVHSGAVSFTTGYVITDLNGDNSVTLSDILLVFNNASNFVTKQTPETSMADLNTLTEKNRREMKEYSKKTIGIATDDNLIEKTNINSAEKK